MLSVILHENEHLFRRSTYSNGIEKKIKYKKDVTASNGIEHRHVTQSVKMNKKKKNFTNSDEYGSKL